MISSNHHDRGKRAELARKYLDLLSNGGEQSRPEETQRHRIAAQPTKTLIGRVFEGRELPILDTGTSLGEFTIEREVGCGGMSRVYLATNAQGLPVAIKTPLIASPWANDQLKREFRIARSVAGDSIISVKSVHELNGFTFLAEEFIEGTTSDRWVRGASTPGQLPSIDRVYHFSTCMLQCLRSLRNQNIVHRDIKPDNILIDANGGTTLIDFGLATWVQTIGCWNNPHIQAGTFRYLAPEVVLNNWNNCSADMYSFGRVLFYMLAGRLPFFDLPTETSWTDKRIAQSIEEQLPAHTPSDLVMLCQQLHSFEPSSRPTAAEALEIIAPVTTRCNRSADFSSNDLQIEIEELSRAVQASVDATAVQETGEATVFELSDHSRSERTLEQAVDAIRGDESYLILKSSVSKDERIPMQAVDPILSNLGLWLQNLDPTLRSDWYVEPNSELVNLSPMIASILSPVDQGVQVNSLHGARECGLCDLAELLSALAQDRIVVLYIENIQDSDRQSWQQFERISAAMNNSRLVLFASVDAGNTNAVDRLNDIFCDGQKCSSQLPYA